MFIQQLHLVVLSASMSTHRQQVISDQAAAREARFRDVIQGDQGGFEVCMVPGMGRGVKVTRAFKHNELLLRYFGELVSEHESNRRQAAGPEVGHFYHFKFRVSQKAYVLDATREDGTLGRLMNHSRKNSTARAKSVEIDGLFCSLRSVISPSERNYGGITVKPISRLWRRTHGSRSDGKSIG